MGANALFEKLLLHKILARRVSEGCSGDGVVLVV